MLKTTYDDIWTSFLENCKLNSEDIPQSEEMIYSCISNAVNIYNQKAKKYNNRMQIIECNETMEEVSVKLTTDELLILSNIIAGVVCRNSLLQFSSLYGTYAKEMGISNIKGQTDARRLNAEYFEQKTQSLIEDLVDTFDL